MFYTLNYFLYKVKINIILFPITLFNTLIEARSRVPSNYKNEKDPRTKDDEYISGTSQGWMTPLSQCTFTLESIRNTNMHASTSVDKLKQEIVWLNAKSYYNCTMAIMMPFLFITIPILFIGYYIYTKYQIQPLTKIKMIKNRNSNFEKDIKQLNKKEQTRPIANTKLCL